MNTKVRSFIWLASVAAATAIATTALLAHLTAVGSPIAMRLGFHPYNPTVIDARLVPGSFADLVRLLEASEPKDSGVFGYAIVVGLMDRAKSAPLPEIANSSAGYWASEKDQPVILTLMKLSVLAQTAGRLDDQATLSISEREKLAAIMDQAPRIVRNLQRSLAMEQGPASNQIEATATKVATDAALCAARLRLKS